MKTRTLAVTFASVVAFAVGCNQKDSNSRQLDQVKAETKQAAQDMKDYTFAEKTQFVDAMRIQVKALNADLDKLSAKIEASSDAAKADAKPKLAALRAQVEKLGKQVDEAGGANESAWDNVKAGFNKGYDQLKDSFQQSLQWAGDKRGSDKIAP